MKFTVSIVRGAHFPGFGNLDSVRTVLFLSVSHITNQLDNGRVILNTVCKMSNCILIQEII